MNLLFAVYFRDGGGHDAEVINIKVGVTLVVVVGDVVAVFIQGRNIAIEYVYQTITQQTVAIYKKFHNHNLNHNLLYCLFNFDGTV